MSIIAIEAIAKYMDQRESGIPVSEIKRRIVEFVRARELRHNFNSYSHSRVYFSNDNQNFATRDGERVYRDKVKL